MRITKDRLKTLIREELTRTLSEDGHNAITITSTDPYEYIKIDDVWHTRKKGEDGEWISLAGNEEAISKLDAETEGNRGRRSRNSAYRLNRTLEESGRILALYSGDHLNALGRYTPMRLVFTVEDGSIAVDDSSRVYPDGMSSSEDRVHYDGIYGLECWLGQNEFCDLPNMPSLRVQSGHDGNPPNLTGHAAAEELVRLLEENQPYVLEKFMSYLDKPEELFAMRNE